MFTVEIPSWTTTVEELTSYIDYILPKQQLIKSQNGSEKWIRIRIGIKLESGLASHGYILNYY